MAACQNERSRKLWLSLYVSTGDGPVLPHCACLFRHISGLDPGIPRAVSNKQNKQIGEEDCAHAHRSARKLCTHARYPYPFFPCPPLPRGCTFKPDIDQKSAEMISQRLARLKITGTLCPMAHSIFFRGLCTFTHFLLG